MTSATSAGLATWKSVGLAATAWRTLSAVSYTHLTLPTTPYV